MTPQQAATIARVVEENQGAIAGAVQRCVALHLEDGRTFLIRPDGSYQQAKLGTMHEAKSPRL